MIPTSELLTHSCDKEFCFPNNCTKEETFLKKGKKAGSYSRKRECVRPLCVFSQSNKVGTVILKRSVFKVCLCCAELSASPLSNTNCYVLISHGDNMNLYIDVLGKWFPLNSDSNSQQNQTVQD